MILSNRLLIGLSALNGLLGVGFGAFAAHGIPDLHAKELIHTGATYELIHAAAALAMLSRSRLAALMTGGGGLVFAVTLYALAAGAPGWVGAVTPIGGVLMIGGWAVLLVTAVRASDS